MAQLLSLLLQRTRHKYDGMGWDWTGRDGMGVVVETSPVNKDLAGCFQHHTAPWSTTEAKKEMSVRRGHTYRRALFLLRRGEDLHISTKYCAPPQRWLHPHHRQNQETKTQTLN